MQLDSKNTICIDERGDMRIAFGEEMNFLP